MENLCFVGLMDEIARWTYRNSARVPTVTLPPYCDKSRCVKMVQSRGWSVLQLRFWGCTIRQ